MGVVVGLVLHSFVTLWALLHAAGLVALSRHGPHSTVKTYEFVSESMSFVDRATELHDKHGNASVPIKSFPGHGNSFILIRKQNFTRLI